jgi:hypothetical protein
MIKIVNISESMREKLRSNQNSAWSRRGNTGYFWIFRSPWSYDSNKSRIKTIGGSYKRLCPNHRVQHVLKSVLDSTQRWSKTGIAPLFELHFRWMTTCWKGNFIKFSIELYFDICSVQDRGGNPWKRDSEEMVMTTLKRRAINDSIKHTISNSEV